MDNQSQQPYEEAWLVTTDGYGFNESLFEDSSLGQNDTNSSFTQADQWYGSGDETFRHSKTITLLLIVAYVIILIIGVVGNSLVVCVVLKSPRMRTVTNLFILNLAIADLLVVLFCLPPTLLSNILVRKYFFYYFYDYLCWLLGIVGNNRYYLNRDNQ